MDAAGAAGRQLGGERRRGGEDERDLDERQRVERVDLEQQAAQQACRSAGDYQPEAARGEQAHDAGSPSAMRMPIACVRWETPWLTTP